MVPQDHLPGPRGATIRGRRWGQMRHEMMAMLATSASRPSSSFDGSSNRYLPAMAAISCLT